jgi:type III secretory pathway component EscV
MGALRLGGWRDTENERLVRAVEHPVKAVAALTALIVTLDAKVSQAFHVNADTTIGLQEARSLLQNMRRDIMREYGVINNDESEGV